MKKTTRCLSVLLSVLMLFSAMCVSVSAASYSYNYSGYNVPETNDYAYWNGKKVVATATKNEIKWMQAALNYCIKYRGLDATLLNVDGSFGPASKKATEAFQKAAKIGVDGKFGPGTIKKMKEVLNNGNQNTLKANTKYTVTLKDGSVFNTYLHSTNGSAVTLPKLNPRRIAISYSANGGRGAPSKTTATIYCLGWSTLPDSAKVQYSCGTKITPNSNMTLYPVWQTLKISSATPTNGNKVFVGWSTNKNATSATYKAGQSVDLSGRVTLYAVWKNFDKKNILQWDYKSTYYNGSNISASGCGVVSAVSAVYNATGNFIEPTTVAAWAYKAGYYNNPRYNKPGDVGGGINSRDAYIKAFVNKYGEQYGFKSAGSGNKLDGKIKNHLANGGTAIVHVNQHYMCLAGYNEDNNTFLVYDPYPGIDRDKRLVGCRRKGLTSAEGIWIHESQLTKGNINTNPIYINWYYLIEAK